jgi:hypothetical protein
MLSLPLFVSAVLFGAILGVLRSVFDFVLIALGKDAMLVNHSKVQSVKDKIIIFVFE